MAKLAGLLCVLLLAGCISPAPTSTPTPGTAGGPSSGLPAFGMPVATDARTGGSEPSVAIDADGRIFDSYPTGLGTGSRLTLSEDGGATWKALDPNPRAPVTETGAGGGDTSIALGPDGSIYVTDLEAAAGSTVSSSHDHGKTWSTTPLGGPFPDQDREWNTVDSRGAVYLLSDNLVTAPAGATWVSRSTDGGQTFVPLGMAWDVRTWGGGVNGPLVVSPKDVLEVAHQCHDMLAICLTSSADGGATWSTVLVAERGVDTFHDVTVAAVDKAGATYVTWSDAKAGELDVWMSASADGTHWSTPAKVNSGTGTHLYPFTIAGAAGRVGVAWYETSVAGDPNDVVALKDADWHVAYAMSADALAATPAFVVVNATGPIHHGTISTRGFNPTDQNPPDRGLGDFLTAAIDPKGHAAIAFVQGSRGGESFRSMLVQQTGGPTLLG